MAGDRTERLLNLVIALLATSQPVSRSSIRTGIPGYDGNDVAFERKFERDKDELRSMGIPVETVIDSGGEVQGYRIRREAYALPELRLTTDERAAVALAAAAWRDAVAGPIAGSALIKLQAQSPEGYRSAPSPITLTAREAALLPLMAAVRERGVVTFDYSGPGDEAPMTRTVSAWRLHIAQGSWYLIGFDHDRGGERTFRLSRITGTVRAASGMSAIGADARSSEGAADRDAEPVTVSVAWGRGGSLRQVAEHVEGDTLTITSVAGPALLGRVCAAADGARVLAPADVIAQVVSALDRIIALHDDASSLERSS